MSVSPLSSTLNAMLACLPEGCLRTLAIGKATLVALPAKRPLAASAAVLAELAQQTSKPLMRGQSEAAETLPVLAQTRLDGLRYCGAPGRKVHPPKELAYLGGRCSGYRGRSIWQQYADDGHRTRRIVRATAMTARRSGQEAHKTLSFRVANA